MAGVDDAAVVAAIYAPYVRDTCVSFETEAPDADAMAGRIGRTLATHPWLVAVQDGAVAGYAYAGRHRERAAYRWAVDVAVHVDGGQRRAGAREAARACLAHNSANHAADTTKSGPSGFPHLNPLPGGTSAGLALLLHPAVP